MNQLLDQIDALEVVSRDQQRRIDELESDKTHQQRRIDELESRIDALESDGTKKRQITEANGLVTKRIRMVTVDFSFIDRNIIIQIALYLPTIDLTNLGRTCGRFGLSQDGQ